MSVYWSTHAGNHQLLLSLLTMFLSISCSTALWQHASANQAHQRLSASYDCCRHKGPALSCKLSMFGHRSPLHLPHNFRSILVATHHGPMVTWVDQNWCQNTPLLPNSFAIPVCMSRAAVSIQAMLHCKCYCSQSDLKGVILSICA